MKSKTNYRPQVTIISNRWNDSETINFVGKTGTLINSHPYKMVDVQFPNDVVKTFHLDELKFN